MTRAAIAAFALVAFVLVVPGLSLATQISPEPAPSQGGACPTEPLIPGSSADYGALVVILQPGPSSGTTCALPAGGTLVGDQFVLGLYTPNPIPNATVPLTIEEFVPKTVTVSTPGPNNTTLYSQKTVQAQVQWANSSLSSARGQTQEDIVTVPPVASAEQLTIGLLGINETVTIVVPGAGVAIPQSYPELLLHDFGFEVAVIVAFVVGVGLATVVRMRARHVERLWPFGVLGGVATFGFAGWLYSNYPLSVIPLGSSPEAVIAAPVVFAGMYLWLAFMPTEAKRAQIRFPVADVRNGDRLYDVKEWREFNGPERTEYIGTGGNGALLRLLGHHTVLDNRVLTETPHRTAYAGFRSIRHDIAFAYYAWAEVPGGPKIRTVVKSHVILFPWRKRAREEIARIHQNELRDRDAPPEHVGFFFHVTPSRAFIAANGRQVAVLVEAWINGTLQNSTMGLALQKVLKAYMSLRAEYKTLAIDYGHKLALALQAAEEFPDSPVAEQMLSDLNLRLEAEILNQDEWYRFVEKSADESPGTTAPKVTARTVAEATEPRPPWRRGLGAGGGTGAPRGTG